MRSQKKAVRIDFDGLLHHTLVVGQSGSGKSFFVARLIEEILLRTSARVLIVDPNGDFRKVGRLSEKAWVDHGDRFAELYKIASGSNPRFDEKESFANEWKKRRFIYLNPAFRPESPSDTGPTREIHQKLVVHWDELDDELKRFLWNAGSSPEPKVAMGIETVVGTATKAKKEATRETERNGSDIGYRPDLLSLLEIAGQYAQSNVGLKNYDSAKTLTIDDWYAVQAKISDLRSSYSIWYSHDPRERETSSRPLGLKEFIDGAFDRKKLEAPTYWDALVLSLDSTKERGDPLLAVEVALSRLWDWTKTTWRERADQEPEKAGEKDTRVPTFVVLDEAHNFAPEKTSDPLQAKVTSRLIQIASEGRKYGLYCILATQRPTKLHKELVPECENCCLLRIQAEGELEFARHWLGVNDTKDVKGFLQGQGLFTGRWVVRHHAQGIDTSIAPARTIVGGGGLSKYWEKPPEGTPPIAPIKDSISNIAEFVRTKLQNSTEAITLPELANELYDEFDVLTPGNWLGRRKFTDLLKDVKDANFPQLEIDLIPPGYAYLRDAHPVPARRPTSDETKLKDISPEARDIIRRAHYAFGLPLLNPSQFKFILETISNKVQDSGLDLTIVSKAVRDEGTRLKHNIGRSDIEFVLKALLISGHRFETDLLQTPGLLAEAFSKSVAEGLRKKGLDLKPEDDTALRAHLSGGLLDGTASKRIE